MRGDHLPYKRKEVAGDCALYLGDCRDVLRSLPDNSIDSVVTDPPYALVSIQKRFGKPGSKPAKDVYARGAAGFMGKQWDTGEVAFNEEFWAEVYRVLKPGGHVVSFGGTRTYHRMACAIEDAGFEIRDQLQWLYGTGFPKSHDVSKAIDKLDKHDAKLDFVKWMKTTGIKASQIDKILKERGIISETSNFAVHFFSESQPALPNREYWEVIHALCENVGISAPDDIEKFINLRIYGSEVFRGREVVGQQSGTKLAVAPGQKNNRSATELDITKPATTEAEQWEGWGTALKPANEPICLARKPLDGTVAQNVLKWGTGALNIDGCRVGTETITPHGRSNSENTSMAGRNYAEPAGREWQGRWPANIVHDGSDEVLAAFPTQGDDTESRFFYCAKASRKDRDEGLEGFDKKLVASALARVSQLEGREATRISNTNVPRANTHPTVKPTDLMRWLCRLVTPPGGVILDPFMGSGSTGKAALLEGFGFVGIEREEEYFEISKSRIEVAKKSRQGNEA